MKGSSQADCTPNVHYLSWYSTYAWPMYSGCYPNSWYCVNYSDGYAHTDNDRPGHANGNCKKCAWYAGVEKSGNSSWCYITWWAWMIFYLTVIFGFVVVALGVLICLDVCGRDRKYKQ